MRLVQAMRSTNVRADAIVFNSALSAYARNRLTLWKPARQLPCVCSAKRHARIAWTLGQTRREREQEAPWLNSTTKHNVYVPTNSPQGIPHSGY